MSYSAEDELAVRAQARIGQLLCGKYRLEQLLGIGGMASVYGAVHRNGRHVAIKVLHADLSTNVEIRERFLREGLAANAAKHPGVVEVIDDDVADDGAAFLVMELLAGRSVEEVCETSGLLHTWSVLALASELCAVLTAAHCAGIVHRDIKPANLFITDEGRLKVLDFGIARLRDVASPKRTSTGMVLGTPSFMAPEQANGRASQIDARTDVWAVGATMFVLLSGRAVHEGETAQHVAILAATQPARSLATVAPHVSPAVVAIVDRALARDRAARWSTAAEMWNAIEHARHQLAREGNVAVEAPSLTLRALMASAAQARPTTKGQTVRASGASFAAAATQPAPRPQSQSPLAFAPTAVRLVAAPTAGGSPVSSMAATQAPTAHTRRRGRFRIALPLVLGIVAVAAWLAVRHHDAWGRNATSTTFVTAASVSVAPSASVAPAVATTESAPPAAAPVPTAPPPTARPRRARGARPTPAVPAAPSPTPRVPGPLDTQD